MTYLHLIEKKVIMESVQINLRIFSDTASESVRVCRGFKSSTCSRERTRALDRQTESCERSCLPRTRAGDLPGEQVRPTATPVRLGCCSSIDIVVGRQQSLCSVQAEKRPAEDGQWRLSNRVGEVDV